MQQSIATGHHENKDGHQQRQLRLSDGLHLETNKLMGSILKSICSEFEAFKSSISECSNAVGFKYSSDFYKAAMKEFIMHASKSLSLLKHFLEQEHMANGISVTQDELDEQILAGTGFIDEVRQGIEQITQLALPKHTSALIEQVRQAVQQEQYLAQNNSVLKILLQEVETVMNEQYPRDGMSATNLLLSNVNKQIEEVSSLLNDARQLVQRTTPGNQM